MRKEKVSKMETERRDKKAEADIVEESRLRQGQTVDFHFQPVLPLLDLF